MFSIHEFQETAIIPFGVEHVWDINHILPEGSGVGLFLKAIVGYNGNPSLIEVVGYVAYLAAVLGLYLRSTSRNTRPVPNNSRCNSLQTGVV